MKRNLMFGLLLIVLAVPLLEALGQEDYCRYYYSRDIDTVWVGTDTLECDTVYIGCVRVPDAGVVEGDSFAVPINVYLDQVERPTGMTFGFEWDYDNVVLSSFSYAGGILDDPSVVKQENFSLQDEHKVLTGFIYFGAGGIPVPSSGKHLLLTLYFTVLPGAELGTDIDIDSVFVPPAGFWELAYTSTTATTHRIFPPIVSDCPNGTPDVILNVHEYSSPVLPASYSLSQNWPNPFNPTTMIDFDLPRSGHVTLEVFNTLGQRVKILIDEELNAGYKGIEWNGTNEQGNQVASGIYFYRMSVNDFTESKKMMLLK